MLRLKVAIQVVSQPRIPILQHSSVEVTRLRLFIIAVGQRRLTPTRRKIHGSEEVLMLPHFFGTFGSPLLREGNAGVFVEGVGLTAGAAG